MMTAHLLNELQKRVQYGIIQRTPADMREPLGEKTMVCQEHGEYLSAGTRYMGKHEIWTQCPDCVEAEKVAALRKEAEHKASIERARIEARLGQANIPQRFVGRTFDNYNATTDEQVNALKIAKEYAENFDEAFRRGQGLIFSGLPGTGKSHLAISVLQHVIHKHCGLYTTCMSLIRMVRNTWRSGSEQSETDVLNELARVPLLVIDEIGVQYGTEGEQTIIFEILDRRYRDMQPTILLTNQAKQGLKDYLGERSFDRLTETSRWVSFDWPSYRVQARKEAA